MARFLPALAFSFCLFLPFCAQAQPFEILPAAKRAAVDRAVHAEMARQQLVGVAIGVISGGRVVYTSGYGFSDLEARQPVTTGTLFRWASVSKPLTAVAALQLVEGGQLDLAADVRGYVPEYPPQKHKISTYDLLCHQGGIVHYSNGPVIPERKRYDTPHPFADVVTALDTFKKSPPVAVPGEKYSYTSHGYILLSAVVQRAGKADFARQVQDRIARPLGMTSLQPDYQWVDIPGRATGYRKDGGRIVRSADTDVSWKLGGGGFISNIDDMARFAAGLIGGRLVGKKTEALMWEPRASRSGPTSYGLGFHVSREKGQLKVWHNGDQEKVRTRMVLYPLQGHGVVVMTNSEYADPGKISTAVYKALSAAK